MRVAQRRQQRKYFDAKRKAKSGPCVSKRKPEPEKINPLESSDRKNLVFKQAKRIKRQNQDIVGDKCVEIDEGCLT